MKRVFALIAALILLISMAACGGAPGSDTQEAGAQTADEEVYTITLSHQYATTTAFHDMVVWWEEQLETRSNGRIQVEEFPSSQLMPPDQEFAAMLDGRIQALSLIHISEPTRH